MKSNFASKGMKSVKKSNKILIRLPLNWRIPCLQDLDKHQESHI